MLRECCARDDGRAVEIADAGVQAHRHQRHLVRAAHAPRDEMAGGEGREDLAGSREVHLGAHEHDRVIYRVEGSQVVIYLIVDGRRDMQSVLARRLLGV